MACYIEVASQSKTVRELQRDKRRLVRGYVERIATTTSTTVRRPIRATTQAFYEVMIREWDLFIAEYDGAHDPTDVKTAKDFILYFTSGRSGRNETGGRLTVAYTHMAWRSFMAAWEREHNTSFSRCLQDTVVNFIRGGDSLQRPDLTSKTRPSRNFTRTDFLLCVQQLWQHDWYDFVHERYRVGLHLLLLLHCNTSARRNEFETHLRYADVSLAMVWLDETTQPQLVIDFKRTNAKGLQEREREQPEHMLYELVGLPFYCNSVALFVAAALADGVLRDYRTWEDICAIQQPQRQKHLILEYEATKRDWPLFPRSSRTGVLNREHTSRSLTSRGVADLGFRAGFRDPVSLHAPRREVLLQVDNYGYSCNERMRFAAHVDSNTYARSYQTSLTRVDGGAAFFSYEPGNPQLHEIRRGYSWNRNPNPRATLSATAQEMLDTAVPCKSDVSARSAGSSVLNDTDVADVRQRVYDRRKIFREQLLREENCAMYDPNSSSMESDFEQTRKIMPQRDRLATNFFLSGSLRDSIGSRVMEDLIALCRSNAPRTYCKGLNSRGDCCDTCGKCCERGDEYVWWRHLYHCRQEAARRELRSVDFCFLCLKWFAGRDDWLAHTEHHAVPLRCSMVVFRHNVVRPALCPACLHPAQFRQFISLTTWKSHLQSHLSASAPFICPHPRCAHITEFGSLDDLRIHWKNVHEIDFDKIRGISVLNNVNKEIHHRFVQVHPQDQTMTNFVSDTIRTVQNENLFREAPPISSTSQGHVETLPLDRQAVGHEDGLDLLEYDDERYDQESAVPHESSQSHVDTCPTSTTFLSPSGFSIIVPPVPGWWKQPRASYLSSDMHRKNTSLSKVGKATSRGRGRPKGSRNRKSIQRDQKRTRVSERS